MRLTFNNLYLIISSAFYSVYYLSNLNIYYLFAYSLNRILQAEIPPSPVAQGPKQMSSSNLGQPPVEGSGNEMFDAECLKLINEYFYGVRIFPGQDPTHVYVGWVTTQYHLHSKEFNKNKVRRGSVYIEDDYEMAIERIDRQSCYVVRADELFNEVTQDASGKGPRRACSLAASWTRPRALSGLRARARTPRTAG